MQTRQYLRSGRVALCLTFIALAFATKPVTEVKADELNPEHVPADAKWLIHIDQDALNDLEVTKEIREMYPQITAKVRDWFKGQYGIDLQEDFHSLTMFSRDYRIHTGTVLLHTDYEASVIKSALQDVDSLKTTRWKDHVLYTITIAEHDEDADLATHHAPQHFTGSQSKGDHGGGSLGRHDKSGGKQMTVYLGDELIMLASSVPNAKSVLRLLDDDSESLEEVKSPLITEAPEGSVIYGAAVELGRLDQSRLLLPLMQQQERCIYAFGERDDTIFEVLTLTAQSEEAAVQTTEVLEGLIAYEKLCAAGSEPLTELMSSVRLAREGLESTVIWEADTDTVVNAFDELKQRLDQWMSLDFP